MLYLAQKVICPMTISQKNDFSSTQESLELLYHISREIASTLDLSTVLQRVLGLSMRTIGAVSSSIIVIDEDEQPLDAAIIYADELLEHTPTSIKALLTQGLAGWVVKNRQPALILNTKKDERWIKSSHPAQKNSKAKSVVSVPIIARDQLVGVITLSHPVPFFFTNDHLNLVQAIADQTAIAILNARLYASSQQQVLVMGALANSAASITASLNLDSVLHDILNQIHQALNVEVVSLALVAPEDNALVFRATTQPNTKIVGKKVKFGEEITGWVAQSQQGIIVSDVAADPRFAHLVDENAESTLRAVICAPIISEVELIGVLQAANPLEGSFAPEALTFISGIGSLAGTAIRHAQLFEELQSAHLRYRDLYNSSIDAIIITNRDGIITEVNDQAILYSCYTKEELIHNDVQCCHTIDIEVVGEKLEKITQEETFSYESELQASDERLIPIQVHVHIVHIAGEEHLQWTFRDITERKELDQLRDDLISMVYHDLRSPLANVVSRLDVLDSIQSFDEDPTIHSLFNIAVRSTKRIERLTNSLLDFNRLESGQAVTNTNPTHPSSIIQAAVEAVEPIAHNKEQQIFVRIQENTPVAEVDENMIQRVLINLMENAVKYTPPESHITVGAAKAGHELCFWVEDTGPGIPSEKRATIFDKYTRLHGKGGPKGIGLGLAYCKLAVEGHGGRIWVDVTNQGGARFAFTLPIANET